MARALSPFRSGVLPFLCVFPAAYRMRLVQSQHLADDHPVEQHPQRGQPSFHRRPGMFAEDARE